MIRRLAAVAAIVAVMVLAPGIASAHPLGNFTINLYSGVSVVPGQLRVDYVVDMAEDPTYQAKFDIDANGDKVYSPREFAAWATQLAPQLASDLSIRVNGTPVQLSVTCSSAYFRPGQTKETPTLRFEGFFVGTVPTAGRVTISEGNYADRVGWREITASGPDGVTLSGSSVPVTSVSNELLSYPQHLLSSPLRTTSASFSYRTAAGASAPAMPATCQRSGGSGARPSIADSGFARLVDRSGLPVMALALLLAIGFGAWHALLPGHGKTLMAAYMVGARSRMRQAVAIGLAVALMHTSSVLALGMLVLTLEHTFRPDLLYPWLGLGSGLVAIGLGTALLVSRLSDWAELRHPRIDTRQRSHDHERAHDHGVGQHSHDVPNAPVLSRKGLVALAVAGGILPAPAALLVMLASIEAHRAAFGFALIGAFSAGLAGALIAVGVAAFHARERLALRLSSVWGRLIPVLSASAIVAVGLFLAVRGATQVRF